MPNLSGARESVLYKIADALLNARRTGTPIQDLPEGLRPESEDEAFVVQDIMMKAYGEIGGWKIGAKDPDSTPFFAPMPQIWMGEDGSIFRGPLHRLYGVEAEIAFILGEDLPERSEPYTREEVTGAIAYCHPAIELIESAFADPLAVPRTNMMADMQMHGGFIAGPPFAGWKEADWATESVTLLVDGSVRVEKTGSNPAGSDLMRLLVYLVNEGASRTGGLREGQWVTTGSWTGVTWSGPAAVVTADFEHAGRANMEFADREDA